MSRATVAVSVVFSDCLNRGWRVSSVFVVVVIDFVVDCVGDSVVDNSTRPVAKKVVVVTMVVSTISWVVLIVFDDVVAFSSVVVVLLTFIVDVAVDTLLLSSNFASKSVFLRGQSFSSSSLGHSARPSHSQLDGMQTIEPSHEYPDAHVSK